MPLIEWFVKDADGFEEETQPANQVKMQIYCRGLSVYCNVW